MTASRPVVSLRELASRGGAMALSLLLPGLRSLLLLGLLAEVSPAAVSVLGLVQSGYGMAIALTAGLSISTVGRLVRRRGEGTARDRDVAALTEIVAVSRVASVALLFISAVLAVAGVVILDADQAALLAAAYVGLLVGMWALPIGSVYSAVLQVQGRESANLVVATVSTVVSVAGCAALSAVSTDPIVLVAAFGAVSSLTDVAATAVRRAVATRSGPGPTPDWARIRRAARQVPLRTAVAALPRSVAPSVDVVVLASTFTLAVAVAAVAGPADGAATAAVIALLRTLIVPLKAVGTVAGRLVRTGSDGVYEEAAQTRLVVARLLPGGIALAVALIVLRDPLSRWFGDGGPLLSWLLVFAAVQLLIEPITGIGSSMLKVLVGPQATLGQLTATMWGLVVPGLGLVALLGGGAVAVSATLLLGRAVFACGVILTWRRWRRLHDPARSAGSPTPDGATR